MVGGLLYSEGHLSGWLVVGLGPEAGGLMFAWAFLRQCGVFGCCSRVVFTEGLDPDGHLSLGQEYSSPVVDYPAPRPRGSRCGKKPTVKCLLSPGCWHPSLPYLGQSPVCVLLSGALGRQCAISTVASHSNSS